MITVVDVIPAALSGETHQDSEPNIAVNPANPAQIAITAFTPDPMGGSNAPIYISTDGGATWLLNSIVPSSVATTLGTYDITARFAAAGGKYYAGILREIVSNHPRLNVLRSPDFTAPVAMGVIDDRVGQGLDQPFTQATTVMGGADAGKDRVYVGVNDFNAPGGRTATVEQSLDAGAAIPKFTPSRLEQRSTAGQNGPQIRPAVHPDGTVYAIFYGWRSFSAGGAVTSDVVVARDDNWGQGARPFTALADPSDSLAGRLVATGLAFTWNGTLAQERLGGDLAIGVAPDNSSTVYIAYCDTQAGAYTMHIRRSLDRGVSWSADLKVIPNAKNPALAINDQGRVGLAYQRVTDAGASQRWETHVELSSDGFASSDDTLLATTPADVPVAQFLPYLGDYIGMMAVGEDFYGTFCANNTPDMANFPNGVTFLRNHDFGTKNLLANDGVTPVTISIDPFFFRISEETQP